MRPALHRGPKPAIGLSAAVAVGLLSACAAGTGAYRRWQAMWADPVSRSWARCIEDHSHRWASHHVGTVPDAAMVGYRTSDEAFAAIITACQSHAPTAAWQALSPGRRRQMLRDAHWRFKAIENDVFFHMQEGII